MNIDNRFMAKVDKGDSSSCWLWMGSLNNQGYGQLGRRRHGKLLHYQAHRYSFEMHNGHIPDGLCVLHKCDRPRCVRPDHLFLGTRGDNAKDRDLKGRVQRGEQHYRAKLLDADVTSIRTFLTLGEKQKDVAEFFGVAQQTISKIKNGETWRWQIG